ncbi:MAG: T9SS type A sorting domain-containing protein [Bacteroidales bacterium]|nr:T9SS type A sorting domain-containing protein [Bacteroidales bacterium]
MNQYLLISVFIFFSFISLNAQKSAISQTSANANPEFFEKPMPIDGKAVEADFRANRLYGSAPLTVQFTDRSEGEVVKWRWLFGDGSVDTLENPVHTYGFEGIYTVKLTVWDADSVNSSTATKADYIRAVGYGMCDSVNYDIPGSYYLYRLDSPNSGFLSGNNSRGDLAKANYFYINEEKGLLMGGLYYFAIKSIGLASDPQIVFNAWDNDGPANGPGTVMDFYSKPLSEINVDDQGTGIYPATVAFFDQWVSISDDFFLGFELPQTPGDSLAVFTNKTSAATNGTGWEKTVSGEWQPYQANNPGFTVDNAIFPIICQPTGIDNHIFVQNIIVYPVPAKDNIYITFFDEGIAEFEVSISDLSGRLVIANNNKITSGTAIDVSHLSKGLYILRLNISDGVINRKIMIE